MATREELAEKYRKDRKEKILKLQGIFSSQITQEVKRYSKLQISDPERGLIDSSYISAFYTANDFYPKDELLWDFLNLPTSQRGSKIRKDFQDKLSNKDEPFGYLLLTGYCGISQTGTFINKKFSLNVGVFETSYLKLPNETNPSLIESIRTDYNTIVAESYQELSKALSSLSYPISQINENKGFSKHIESINEELEGTNFLEISSIPVIVNSFIDIPDGTNEGVRGEFNNIFPKPEGWDELFGTPQNPGTTGVSGVAGVAGTTGVSGVAGVAGTTGVSGVAGVAGTTGVIGTTEEVNNQTTDSGQTNATPQAGTSGNTRKYLSIEAVKDDEIVIRTENTGSSNYLSTVFLQDDPVVEDYYSESQIKQIQTEKVNSQSKDKVQPGSEVNKEVVNKEIEQKKQETEAQRKSEESDALEKKQVKEKSNGVPDGSNPDLPEGKTVKIEEKSKPIPEDKKPKAMTQIPPRALTFIKWMNSVGKDPTNGIFFRGISAKLHPKNSQPPIDFGSTESRFKNLFSFGSQLDKIFKGYTVESPIDAALLMNSGGVGRFNKNWPYMFGEGSEIHAAITRARSVVKESQGGIGSFASVIDHPDEIDTNWAANPFWCGLCTNFMLYSNSKYSSDSNPVDITNTRNAPTLYSKSPFNIFGERLDSRKKKLQNDISSKKGTISGNNSSIKTKKTSLEKEKQNAEKNEANYRDNTDPTKYNQKKIDGFYIKVKNLEREIQNLENANKKLEDDIKEYQSELDSISKNSSSGTVYNENNVVALFENGFHWTTKGFTEAGKQLWDKIKNWPGAFVVRRPDGNGSGHVETLLHFSPTGEIYTIGGNTGLDNSDGNGEEYGFKKYTGIHDFNGKIPYFFVHRRGDAKPYTNGIGFSVKQTETYKKYVNDLQVKKDKELNPAAFNILRNIMEI
jgi:hypothetical protein